MANSLPSIFQAVDWIRQCLTSKLENQQPPPYPFDLENEPITLLNLIQKFDLSPFDRNLLLLCLATVLDPSLPELSSKIQCDRNNFN